MDVGGMFWTKTFGDDDNEDDGDDWSCLILKSGGVVADFVGGKTRSERAGADFVGGISICNLLFQNILVGAQAYFFGGKTICNILFQNIKIRRVRGSAFCQKKNNPLLFWQSFS